MKKEDKELLLKDLCARLPYGVRGERMWTAPVSGSPEKGIYVFDTFDINILTTGYYDCGEHGFREVRGYSFKPYLFPLSSMTEKQEAELNKLTYGSVAVSKDYFYDLCNCSKISTNEVIDIVDWLNKNHFDYRGLIEKGLAIDCTNLNIY